MLQTVVDTFSEPTKHS